MQGKAKMVRKLIAVFAFLGFASCAPRGEFTYAPEAAGRGTSEAIFVGTSRKLGPEGFTRDRAEIANFVRYDISVPPEREAGEVRWPRKNGKPDPERDFLTLSENNFADAAAFRAGLKAELARRNQDEAVVYVHGFNNTMAEGVYRVAQMHNDLKVPGLAVHYAWPSRGSVLAYVYDRDSALFGRDGLEELLNELAASGVKRIIIVAHSMGTAVTMETLRQMALRDNQRVLSRINGVVLLSPDLDVDLFRSQARGIGKLPQPFLIFGNRRDRVLGLSSRIAGDPERLGNLTDISRIADLEVTYLDTAAYSEGSGHFNVGNSAALIQLLGGIGDIETAFLRDDRRRVGLLPGVVLTVRNATEIILAPVSAVARGE
jgi:esterase/lipase superfamily enzyme